MTRADQSGRVVGAVIGSFIHVGILAWACFVTWGSLVFWGLALLLVANLAERFAKAVR